MKRRIKYRRKSRKDGRPKIGSIHKILITVGILLFIVGLFASVMIIKPQFLENLLNQNYKPASIKQASGSEDGNSNTLSADNYPQSTNESLGDNTQEQIQENINQENQTTQILNNEIYYAGLASMLSQTPMVQDLPKGETILLRFYNFNTGEREFEKSYILTRGSAKEGYIDAPEITIVMHSKYLPELTNDNLCATITKAKSNDDLGVYTDLSTTKLLMKFSSMTKYKDCLM